MHAAPHTYTYTAFLIITTPDQSGTLVTTDKPTLTGHYHPESTLNIRFYSWYHTFYGSGQIYNNIYPRLFYHRESDALP